MIIAYLTNLLTRKGMSPVFETPIQYNLDYKNVHFYAEDGVILSGWLIKGSKDKVIVQSHFGVQASRTGYTTDGKSIFKLYHRNISFLRQAQYFVEQGYSVLMYDFRNHGNSGRGNNKYISWGSEEAKDVVAAVNFLSSIPDYKHSKIFLLSMSMGANATTFAYGLDKGLKNYPNIKALVSVQPLSFFSFTHAVGLPNFIAKRINKFNLNRGGVDLSKHFFCYLPSIQIPTLVIQNKNDPWTKLSLVWEYYQQLGGEKEMLMLDLPKKRVAAYDWLGKFPQKIIEFFDKHSH